MPYDTAHSACNAIYIFYFLFLRPPSHRRMQRSCNAILTALWQISFYPQRQTRL